MTTVKLAKSTVYYPDRAPLRVVVEADLKSSPQDVWDAIVNYEGWVKWFPGITVCHESTPDTGRRRGNNSNSGDKVGSMRHVEINGLIAEEEIIAWDCDTDDNSKSKIWAFSVSEISGTAVMKCWVERLVLEPIFDSDKQDSTSKGEGRIVGTRARYAAGLDLVWYANLFLRPLFTRSIRQSWQVAFKQLDALVQENKGG